MIPWLHDFGFRDGHVTQAFDEWRLEQGYLLAYMRVGLQLTSEGYDRLWSELGSQPSDGEGPELPDLFDAAVGNLNFWQFEQIHLAAAVRDWATSLGARRPYPAGRRGSWKDLKMAWKGLAGINLERGGVRAVRSRRNWLTHQRGQFRTESQRARLDTHEFGWPDLALRLTQASVGRDMDTLAEAAASVDSDAYRLSWGREPAPTGAAEAALDALMRASTRIEGGACS